MQTHAAPKFRETIRNQTTNPLTNQPTSQTVDVRVGVEVVVVGERVFLLLPSKAYVHDFPAVKTSISNADIDFQIA